MNKKLLLPLIALVIVIAAVVGLRQPGGKQSVGSSATPVPAANDAAVAVNEPAPPPEPAPAPITPASLPPGVPMPQPPPASPSDRFPRPALENSKDPEMDIARNDMENVGLMLRDFRTVQGENPVGTNAEIMKAVMGGNKKGAQLGPPTGMALNEQGELVDRWGTPVFFHQNSATDMEIRSAGPDRKLYTSDDLISK